MDDGITRFCAQVGAPLPSEDEDNADPDQGSYTSPGIFFKDNSG